MNPKGLHNQHEQDLDMVNRRLGRVETRLAVLETRYDGWERRLSDLCVQVSAVSTQVNEVRGELKKSMDYVAGMLRNHIDEEQADREKLLRAALMATLGGASSVLGWFLLLFWEHLIPGAGGG